MKMKLSLLVLMIYIKVPVTMQACSSLPDNLDGTWKSTSLGTITISTSAQTLATTFTFDGLSSMSYFDCQFNEGTQYVFKMNTTLGILGGTLDVFPYGCFDFREASDDSYYFYLNSDKEVTLSNNRFKAIVAANVDTVNSVADVCDSSTVDLAEFVTMIKSGSEDAAISAVQCPDPILGHFDYTFTDQTGTYCDTVNTSTITACTNQSYAEVLIDNTGCTAANPFYSTGGELGCIANVYSSSLDLHYVSFYNRANTPQQFTCVAMQKHTNGTVFLSLMPSDCEPGQVSTVAPTDGSVTGSTMVLQPFYTCKNLSPTSIPTGPVKNTTWLWLILFLVCLGVLILFIIAVVLIHRKIRELEKKRAREKKVLVTEDHPLGEVSIALDAPASMERVPEGYIEVNDELFISPRTFKKKDMMNPMGESSMNLSFKEKSWVGLTPRKSIVEQVDPFTEMDSGVVMPISSLGSKTARSTKSASKQKSFLYNGSKTSRSVMNGDVREPLAITDGRIPYPVVGADEGFEDYFLNREPSFVRESMARSQSVYAPSVGAKSQRAPSVRAPSVRAPSVRAPSVRAPSVRAPSVRAPSIGAKSAKSAANSKAVSLFTRKSDKSKPKLIRSVTNTRIGSVTKRTPQSPRKRELNRSKTMVVSGGSNEFNEGGMAEFMNAEMSNWGDASEAGKSKRSARTARSTAARSRMSTKASPRKSILKKKSRYMSSEEFLTEEEKYNQLMIESTMTPANSASVRGSAGRSLQEEYNDMVRKNDPMSGLRRVGATRKQWH